MFQRVAVAALVLCGLGREATAADSTGDAASQFGALEFVLAPKLSADGKHLSFISHGTGTATLAVVGAATGGDLQVVARADGDPVRITGCGWSALDRLVCSTYEIQKIGAQPVAATR